MTVVDAHQHFWDPEQDDHPWLSGPYSPIRRAFGPADLKPALEAAGVSRTVLVQTQHTLAESRAFLALAASEPFVAGVVAWVDLAAPDVAAQIAALQAAPGGGRLVGVRHLLHEEADDGWLLRDEVRRGLPAVAAAGLVFDLVGTTRHLPAMLRTVEDFPDLRFVLDHIAKPPIRAGEREPWTSLMRRFRAQRSHVFCKLSGMVTEADWTRWRPEQLRPYILEALEIFTPDHCMFGSDWPVCLVAASYTQVKDALESCLSHLDEGERARIFGGTAIEAYGLTP